MGRNSHDGSCSIGDEYIVCNPDRKLLSVDRVDGIGSGEDTSLVLCKVCPFQIRLVLCGFQVFLHSLLLLWSGKLLHQRMLWCNYHICGSEESVATCCVHFKVVVALFKLEEYCSTFASSDPVALHGLYRFRPVKVIKALEKLIAIGCDLQHPLSDVLLFHLGAASFAPAFLHLFVGQSCLAGRTPVDWCVCFVGQTFLVELEEDPLCPPVVVFITGAYLPVPVIGEAETLDLTAEVVDILLCRYIRMGSCLDGVVLCRKTK